MASCYSNKIYTTQLNKQDASPTFSLISTIIVLVLQLIVTILIICYGYRKYKKFVVSRNKNPFTENIKNQMKLIPNQQQEQKLTFLQQFMYRPSKLYILLTVLLIITILALCFALALMTIFAVYQAINVNYSDAQCILSNKVSSFIDGDQSWIGLANIVPNITQLNLLLNTRIQVSINAVKGLLLNGTVASVPPGIGFANHTNIPVINSQSISALNTIVTTNNVSSYINAALNQWLFRNSSLSGTHKFPLCQQSTTFPIPHPITTGQTIQLGYMNTICLNLTGEVNLLIQNGNQVDSLYTQLQNVKTVSSSIASNLSVLNSTYNPIALRANQYSLDFSTLNQNITPFYYVPILVFLAICFLIVVLIIYFLFGVFSTCIKCQCDCECDDEQDADKSRSQSRINKNKKFKQVPFYIFRTLYILIILVNIGFGISSIYYAYSSSYTFSKCQTFKNSMTDSNMFNSLSLSSSQNSLLSPIQKCTSGSNTYFLQTASMPTAQLKVQQLQLISSQYNKTVPLNVLNSYSFAQTEILKGYMLNLQTMPIKTSDFSLIDVLATIQQYSNGTNPNSKQLAQCSAVVIQDQYVFNSVHCNFQALDLVNELTITDPRCIILPSYNGTPGTTSTHLNSAQHTFVLNGTCPSISNMFDPANTNCFLNKRLQLLINAGCTNTAAQLGTRLRNLILFAQEATTYTDVYIQNLRNYFGVYAVMNTNLTEFFVGTNMSQTLTAFGVDSNNILNKIKCDYVNASVNQIYNSYCPKQNNISMIFYDSYSWNLIALFFMFFLSPLAYLMDIAFRVYRVNNFFKKVSQMPKFYDQKSSVKNKLNVSQQTLRNEQQAGEGQDQETRKNIFQLMKEEQQIYKSPNFRNMNNNSFSNYETNQIENNQTHNPQNLFKKNELNQSTAKSNFQKKKKMLNPINDSDDQNPPNQTRQIFKSTNMETLGKKVRYQKVNLSTEEKQIVPPIFFNLDKESDDFQIKPVQQENMHITSRSNKSHLGRKQKIKKDHLQVNQTQDMIQGIIQTIEFNQREIERRQSKTARIKQN